MSTVVDLTDDEIAELKAATKQDNLHSAIRTAMTEYIRYVRRMQLKSLSGKVEAVDNWRDLEEAELKEQHGGPGACAG